MTNHQTEPIEAAVQRALEQQAVSANSLLAEARAAQVICQHSYDRAWADWLKATDRLIAAEDRGRRRDELEERARHAAAVLDSRGAAAMNAANSRRIAQERLAEATNPATAARRVEDERLKRERLAELAERREAMTEDERDAHAAVARIKRAGTSGRSPRAHPVVTDNGDGLAALGRDALRALAKKAGVSVGGHKATLVERLRRSGVTA